MATALSQHAQDQLDKIVLYTTGTIHPASYAVADLVRFTDIDFQVLRNLSGYEIVDCRDKYISDVSRKLVTIVMIRNVGP